MKYSIRYYRGCNILDKADEIIIKYTKRSPALIDFVNKQEYENKRIIVNIVNLENDFADNLNIFKAAYKSHSNMSFLISVEQFNFLSDLRDAGLPFFFYTLTSTLDTLEDMINLGVSDVYIGNELGFSLKSVSKLCKENNINIRVYPNVAQTSSLFNTQGDIKSFYIRPDDIPLYEKYVDIIEFFGELDKQPVLYKIYNQKFWPDDLQFVISNLSTSVQSHTIVPYFGLTRVYCNKKCIGGECKLCDDIIELANALEEKGLGIKLNEYTSNGTDMSDVTGKTLEDPEDIS